MNENLRRLPIGERVSPTTIITVQNVLLNNMLTVLQFQVVNATTVGPDAKDVMVVAVQSIVAASLLRVRCVIATATVAATPPLSPVQSIGLKPW